MQRTISVKGMITIVNTLALFPLIYISSMIETHPEALTEIHNIIQNFKCDVKTAKIATTTNNIYKNIYNGGLLNIQ